MRPKGTVTALCAIQESLVGGHSQFVAAIVFRMPAVTGDAMKHQFVLGHQTIEFLP
jgi:hypothetical protein